MELENKDAQLEQYQDADKKRQQAETQEQNTALLLSSCQQVSYTALFQRTGADMLASAHCFLCNLTCSFFFLRVPVPAGDQVPQGCASGRKQQARGVDRAHPASADAARSEGVGLQAAEQVAPDRQGRHFHRRNVFAE